MTSILRKKRYTFDLIHFYSQNTLYTKAEQKVREHPSPSECEQGLFEKERAGLLSRANVHIRGYLRERWKTPQNLNTK